MKGLERTDFADLLDKLGIKSAKETITYTVPKSGIYSISYVGSMLKINGVTVAVSYYDGHVPQNSYGSMIAQLNAGDVVMADTDSVTILKL